jgi:hypothetical protein
MNTAPLTTITTTTPACALLLSLLHQGGIGSSSGRALRRAQWSTYAKRSVVRTRAHGCLTSASGHVCTLSTRVGKGCGGLAGDWELLAERAFTYV